MERLDNLQVYRRLLSLCDELSELADRCWSPAGKTAILIVANSARIMSRALYKGGVKDSIDAMQGPRIPRRYRVRR